MAKAKYKRRTDGRFGTKVFLHKYNPDGSKKYKWLYSTKSSADLERQVTELKAKIINGTYIDDQNVTFETCAWRWFNTYKIHKEWKTKEMYQNLLKNHITEIKDVKLLDLKKSTIQEELINPRWDKKRICQQLVLMIRQILDFAVEEGLINKNVCTKMELPKQTKSKKRALFDYEKDALRQCINNNAFSHKQAAYILLLYGCGIRPEEALALQKNDFYFEENNEYLKISKALSFQNSISVLKEPKTDSGHREIYIPVFMIDSIKEYIHNLKDQDILFPMQRYKKHMTKSSYRRFWDNIIRIVNLNSSEDVGFTPYIFRHNYCTDLYYKGVSLKEAVRLMGHKDHKMVLEIYTHLDSKKENTKSKLDQINL